MNLLDDGWRCFHSPTDGTKNGLLIRCTELNSEFLKSDAYLLLKEIVILIHFLSKLAAQYRSHLH